ncbi:MAG: F0F1 ATP synthase subunit gamma [Candidatus Omnitrophota bacterium]|jgi:ATP synthase F1 gamma subunit
MQQLLKIKQNVEFNNRLYSILETLKSIAVMQFRALEQKLKVYGSFGEKLDDFFRTIDLGRVRHPFVSGEAGGPVGVVAVTSDQGLLGGLNMRIVAGAANMVQASGGTLIIVGEQGKIYARNFRMPFVAYPGIKDEVRYAQALEVRNYLFEQLGEKRFSSIRIVYARALSLVNQQIESDVLLPLTRAQTEEKPTLDMSEFLYESSLSGILEYLAYVWVGKRIGDIFGFSRLAEMAARYMHLEESNQKILALNKKLKQQYFKCRHEMLDQNMRELFAARMLYAE